MTGGLADLLGDMAEDLTLQREYVKDPDAVMTRYNLTDDEKAALRSGDEALIHTAVAGGAGGAQVFKVIVRPRPPKPK